MGKPKRTPEEKAILKEFGLRVRKAREARGWTQEGLGEHVEMDRTYVGGIERGERNLSLIKMNQLALVLGQSATGFLPCRTRPLGRRTRRK